MKLTNLQLRNLYQAIKHLDGRPEQVKDGDGKHVGILMVPFDMDGKTRLAIARNFGVVEPLMATLDKTLATLKNGDGMDLLAAEEEVALKAINVASLKIDTNKLPPSIVASLLPILEGEL